MITSSGWSFISDVPGQMTHPVASLTLDSARSCVMQSAFLTQRKASSIPTIFSWGGSIRPEGFLSSILLLAVIIVAVAIVVAVVLVVVDAIIGVVVVVSGVPSIIKLSFVIIDSLYRIVLCYLIHQPMSYDGLEYEAQLHDVEVISGQANIIFDEELVLDEATSEARSSEADEEDVNLEQALI
ncbi:hypothetical protein Tco_0326866 [Tanacetum coccineum]